MAPSRRRAAALVAILVGGFFAYRAIFDPGVAAVEAVNPAGTGYLGGLGLPVLLAWPVGGLLAAGAAWIIGKTALGLRSDYLAIATLGIAEIILAILKNEDWLSRGVKNVSGIPRPCPTRSTCRTIPDSPPAPRNSDSTRSPPRRSTSSWGMPGSSRWSSCCCCGWRSARSTVPGAG